MTDENNVTTKKDTSLDTIAYIEIRITTIKANIPDEYYEDKRRLKAFII